MAEVYTGRFAPSPTGLLHAGSLVAALASWLDARTHRGQWLVRIEDVDTPRCVPGADQAILQQLAACGLVPDGPVLWQSQRGDAYAAALQSLVNQGWAYPCGCSRKEIESAQAVSRHSAAVYPGTCREGLKGKPARAWRLNVQAVQQALGLPAITHWRDRRLGAQQQNVCAEVGDFVLRRADGTVSPADKVYIYPIDRFKGRDFDVEPLAEGLRLEKDAELLSVLYEVERSLGNVGRQLERAVRLAK
jgi:glutamyl-Q tRNA(Asp) synthetase